MNKLKYDPQADMTYLKTGVEGKVHDTLEAEFQGHTVALDVDKNGNILGIEFFGELKVLSPTEG